MFHPTEPASRVTYFNEVSDRPSGCGTFFSNATRSVANGMSDLSDIMGKILLYSGVAGLFIMAAVGTVSIDLVLLSYAENHHDAFLTGWILGSMWSSQRMDPMPALIVSPITSVIAVVLSFALEVPAIGLGIMAGWTLAASLVGLGMAMIALSECLNPEREVENDLCCC